MGTGIRLSETSGGIPGPASTGDSGAITSANTPGQPYTLPQRTFPWLRTLPHLPTRKPCSSRTSAIEGLKFYRPTSRPHLLHVPRAPPISLDPDPYCRYSFSSCLSHHTSLDKFLTSIFDSASCMGTFYPWSQPVSRSLYTAAPALEPCTYAHNTARTNSNHQVIPIELENIASDKTSLLGAKALIHLIYHSKTSIYIHLSVPYLQDSFFTLTPPCIHPSPLSTLLVP